MPSPENPMSSPHRSLVALATGLTVALVLALVIALGGQSSGHAMSGGQTMPGKNMGESTHVMPSGQAMEDLVMGH